MFYFRYLLRNGIREHSSFADFLPPIFRGHSFCTNLRPPKFGGIASVLIFYASGNVKCKQKNKNTKTFSGKIVL